MSKCNNDIEIQISATTELPWTYKRSRRTVANSTFEDADLRQVNHGENFDESTSSAEAPSEFSEAIDEYVYNMGEAIINEVSPGDED